MRTQSNDSAWDSVLTPLTCLCKSLLWAGSGASVQQNSPFWGCVDRYSRTWTATVSQMLSKWKFPSLKGTGVLRMWMENQMGTNRPILLNKEHSSKLMCYFLFFPSFFLISGNVLQTFFTKLYICALVVICCLQQWWQIRNALRAFPCEPSW